MRNLGSLDDSLSRSVRMTIRNVLVDRTSKQNRVLRDNADARPPRFRDELSDILTVEQHCAGRWVVEAQKQQLNR